jgi:tetratricopeptide (TPR) repeat protein
MSQVASLKRGLSHVWKAWREERFDLALNEVNRLLEKRPDNSQLLVLRAELAQLQEDGGPSLREVREELTLAVALDPRSPNALIELGYFHSAVEDDAEAASKSFRKAIKLCRDLLKEALLGQAEVLLELERDDEARTCLLEAVQLISSNGRPDLEDMQRIDNLLERIIERNKSVHPAN